MDILQQLTSLLSTSGSFNQISRNANTSPEKAQQLATIAIPILLEALNRNTATLQGVRSLSYALDDHQHFDLNNLSEFFQNIDTKDGARILRHVFADKNARVQKNLAKQSGLNVGQVGILLNQLAPMVLGLLGAQKKNQHISTNEVPMLTSSILGAVGKTDEEGRNPLLEVASQFLDNDNESITIEVIETIFNGF